MGRLLKPRYRKTSLLSKALSFQHSTIPEFALTFLFHQSAPIAATAANANPFIGNVAGDTKNHLGKTLPING